ncbi:hypothetical protein PACTADRAFT_47546 [Pachysolen tannophilus NRRL Y-2460]|uniref:Uncharacterized protein n=1 Tax=Pachysolen tannophilus NRRL Y-2460 TaxID=669874 RepID=A0A1E4U106_PACTA|nr:hypothetical protein PACTADRAFT_47546 [Pachysolen tannophilus NRRL Y-2460]
MVLPKLPRESSTSGSTASLVKEPHLVDHKEDVSSSVSTDFISASETASNDDIANKLSTEPEFVDVGASLTENKMEDFDDSEFKKEEECSSMTEVDVSESEDDLPNEDILEEEDYEVLSSSEYTGSDS